MPELPEIEHLKRSLEPTLVGAAITRVLIKRPDVIHHGESGVSQPIKKRDLLHKRTITRLDRRGKQLAILTDGPAICIHLGMSGNLRLVCASDRPPRTDHVHCKWHWSSSATQGTMLFRDPRRFGGIWVFSSEAGLLEHRWRDLGPDALTIRSSALHESLARSRRPIKAALLDQRVLAGVGNIYADESLFAAGVHPQTLAASLKAATVSKLAQCIRQTLRRAIKAGGSTLRDYADANGEQGWFAVQHRVYGRAGLPCTRCDHPLTAAIVAQRSTVFCPTCQPVRHP